MADSELEDLYELDFYRELIWNQYGVALDSNAKFRSNKRKWSERVSEVFKASGKPWNDGIKMSVKAKVSALVASDPKNALNVHKRSVVDNFVQAVTEKLKMLNSE